jgi:8-oxo-dGTP diphosphatase
MSSERSRASKGAGKSSKGADKASKGAGKTSRGAGKTSKAGGKAARSSPREFSAGGVVVRDRSEVVVIVPTRRAADGSRVLALPKGHVDPGETPIEAAEREVREETGIVARPVTELGETRYWYRRDGRTIPKSVTFYLFKYVDGDVSDHDDEVEEARWLPLERARRELTHAAEREMVDRALAYLAKDR